MITKADFTAVGTAGAKRLIVIFGIFLTACWSVTALVGQLDPTLKCYALGFHECAGAPVALRLLIYSLLHRLGAHWLLDLMALWVIIVAASKHFSPTAFARLYSVGSLAAGAAFLLAAWQLNSQTPLFGGGGGLMALSGGFLIRWPERLDPKNDIHPLALLLIVMLMSALGTLAGQDPDTPMDKVPGSTYLSGLASLGAGLLAGMLHGVLERLHKAGTS